LTAPGNFYFLEFPLEESDSSSSSPICGDGTPFSFAFRRGSDKHVSRLIVELEGGPACWGQDATVGGSCCSSDAALQTPWHSYYDNKRDDVHRARLESCTGVTPGFVKRGVEDLFVRSDDQDLPIALRDTLGGEINPHQWWGVLGGESSNTTDWSYVLIPHCTLDWHLGHQSSPQATECNINSNRSIYHTGGTNLDAVAEWIQAQYPDGLDALVVVSGGKLGGCDDTTDASTIATALLGSKLSSYADNPSSDTLVVTEGSGLFSADLPNSTVLADRWNAMDIPQGSTLKEGVQDWIQSSPESVKIAWLASPGGRGGNEEDALVGSLQKSKDASFHILQAPPSRVTDLCPVYSFPESSDSYIFGTFLRSIIHRMSWNRASVNDVDALQASNNAGEASRLSFFSIAIIVLALIALAWVVYFIYRNYRTREGKPAPHSPTDLWFLALTRYPLIFLLISVAIPLSLAIAAYVKAGNQIPMNLDFDSYLEINTPLENVRRNYDEARAFQRDSLTVEAENCELLTLEGTELPFAGRRELSSGKSFSVQIDHEFDFEQLPPHERELSLANMLYASGGEAISVMYQNRNGGNVFEPEVLREIYSFEQSLYEFPGFGEFCFGFGPGRCVPIDSLVTHFFVNGELRGNIDGVVQSFLGNQPALWKLDQNFGPDNLQSEVIRSFIFLKNVGGDQRAARPFLESLYRDFFWKTDHSNTYSSMVFTWDNTYLQEVEADDALRHDTLWSIGSLCFIALMILFKVRSVFVVFFSMLGLILAFAASYYWASIHFAIQSPTLLWVAGLYVMLGIGADDIFLMVDSFEHTKVLVDGNEERSGGTDANDAREAKLDVLRDRMKKAYQKAGSMMLVSSVTTAICFFSNAFAIVVVIQEFGLFMGLVVLVNFLHVMTILPSAILVNEFYVLPLQEKLRAWYQMKFRPSAADEEVEEKSNDPQGDTKDSDNDSLGSHDEISNEMNRMDKWLVTKYAPFINRRAICGLLITLLLAIILGVLGTLHFTASDGNIVLFSEKYNLGRLTVVTDTYFNKDIKKTIETTPDSSNQAPTYAPAAAGAPSTSTGDSDVQEGSGGSASLPESAYAGGEASNGDGSTVTVGNDAAPSSTAGSSPSVPSVPTDPPAVSPQTGAAGSPNGSPVGSSPIGVPGPGSDSGSAAGSSGNGSASGSGGSSPAEEPASGPVSTATSTPVSSIPLGPNTGLDLRRRETISVNLIWGVKADEQSSNLWKVDGHMESYQKQDDVPPSYFDLRDPTIQVTLYEIVRMARADDELGVQPDKPTWIEMLHDFALDTGLGFPIVNELFVGYVQLLKERNQEFASLVAGEIGTQSPGLAGDFTFVSVTLQVDAMSDDSLSLSESIYRKWSAFAKEANSRSPSGVPEMVAQSRIFLDAYRIIFSMFKIPFGAVEALGISIFIGLSANYSLHVVHAYHHSTATIRSDKVKEAIFAVGSPIVASGLSTIGASAFLFGCRTWVFVELGILVCSITAMALLYSMTFLLAWLALAGPLPFEKNGKSVHSWDFRALCPCVFTCPHSSELNEEQGRNSKSMDTLGSESEADIEHAALGEKIDPVCDSAASHSIAVLDRSVNSLVSNASHSIAVLDRSVNSIGSVGSHTIAVIDRSMLD
ncbi:MAG: hypothetical protein SGILL_003889, partial [Bacillariaceae sp.]